MPALPLDVRPIYSRDQGIRLRGLRVHRLRLNRHLPKVDLIARHAHAHSQVLLYLGGAGFQIIAGQTHVIRRGSLFFVPPRAEHSFVDARGFLAAGRRAGGRLQTARRDGEKSHAKSAKPQRKEKQAGRQMSFCPSLSFLCGFADFA